MLQICTATDWGVILYAPTTSYGDSKPHNESSGVSFAGVGRGTGDAYEPLAVRWAFFGKAHAGTRTGFSFNTGARHHRHGPRLGILNAVGGRVLFSTSGSIPSSIVQDTSRVMSTVSCFGVRTASKPLVGASILLQRCRALACIQNILCASFRTRAIVLSAAVHTMLASPRPGTRP